MGKSITRKKSDLTRAQDAFVDFSIYYIKNWTHQELKKYRNKPVVIPVGDYGFFVGPYVIQGEGPDCWKVEQQDQKVVGTFVNKTAAVLYCMYSVKHLYSRANELLELDTKIGRLDNNIKYYEFGLRRAEKTGNKVKYTILLNRYIDAKIQRRLFINNLKKTLNSAKYINFGN